MDNIKSKLRYRLGRRLRLLAIKIYQLLRVFKYNIISDIRHFDNFADYNQPVLVTGQGKIKFGRCSFGFWPSPYYLSGYCHIEARDVSSSIVIEDGVRINNNATIIAERSNIYIGANTLIGTEFTVYDSDFHDIHPARRLTGIPSFGSVAIGENVFIGSRVTVLKGVSIGTNSVIASGSVVSQAVPANCIAGGGGGTCAGAPQYTG